MNQDAMTTSRKNGKILPLLILLVVTEVAVASFALEKKIELSSKRAFFSTIQAEQRLFFIGGFEYNDFVESKTIDVFNLTSNSWEQSLNLTTPRGRITPVVLGSRIYMVGGAYFTSIPFKLDVVTNLFTSVVSKSGPTVRRPLQLSLHNSTLTVVGYFSVDFFDLTMNTWTHNENLTNVMSQHFDTTTIALRNFVFVMGGTNINTQQLSTSIWMIDSISSDPIKFQVFPPTTAGYLSSWFDDTHGAAVIQFANRCFVYHVSSQKWLQRSTWNNTISSVSFLNNTMVFFSDGLWTINWSTMNDTWTPLTQVSFAFTIADQLVYCQSNQVSVVTSTGLTTQATEFGAPSLDIAMSSTIRVVVNSTGAIFTYSSATKQLALKVSALTFKPLRIFRANDSLVHIVGFNGTNNVLYSVSAQQLLFTGQIWFVPDEFVQNYFYGFSDGRVVSADNPMAIVINEPYEYPVWARRNDELYLVRSRTVADAPYQVLAYNAVDVYNFVDNQWEPSINMSVKLNAMQYLQAGVLDEKLRIFSDRRLITLNGTGGWNATSYRNTSIAVALASHPTFISTTVINNTAYLQQKLTTSIFAISTTSQNLNALDYANGVQLRQLASNGKQLVSLNFVLDHFQSVLIFDLETQIWRGTYLQNSKTNMASAVTYNEFVLIFGDEMDYFTYFDLATIVLLRQPFNNSFVPASLFTLAPYKAADSNATLSRSTETNTTVSNMTTLVIAGGYHRAWGVYSNEVKFVTFNLYPEAPVSVVQPTDQPLAQTIGPVDQSSDDPTLVIAIVIPVGVVAVAAVILAILLVRRRERKKSDKNISMTGLVSLQYGEWFVPFSDIQFGDQLGQGGSGQVFKGKWKNTDVALKVSMTQAHASVVSELSVMINMRPHPNVVQLFGFSVHPETNSIILVLEFCNGGSLDTLLYDQQSQVELSKKVYWLQNISKGINHLHSNNVVHRDIAARNVLLHQGEPKVTDFGLSRVVDDQQQRGTTKSDLGPIRWMSPESLRDKQYSTKSDVWSFGILMFEVLSQQEPHLGEDPITIGRRIRNEGVIPQLSSSSQIPSTLSSIIEECCQMSPSARPTIEQILQKLEQIVL